MTAKVTGPQDTMTKAGFVFGDTKSDKPNLVHGVAQLDAYIVAYNDGESKKQVRIVFRVPGSETVYVLNERIAGSFVATGGTDWFNKAVCQKIKTTTRPLETAAEGLAQV
jgi:hypothetical protein